MTLQQRQTHLIEQITTVMDENVLIMLEEELSYHLNNKGAIKLDAADMAELLELVDEPEDKDIVSENEYRKATGKWRTR